MVKGRRFLKNEIIICMYLKVYILNIFAFRKR